MNRLGWTAPLALGVLIASAPPARAVSPQTWRTSGADDWQKTKRESVGVASDGSVALARSAVPVDGIQEGVVWALLRDGRDVLVATGDRGTVYRVDPEGHAVTEVTVIEPEVTALGRDGSGRLLLGAAPDGTIYRWEKGKPVAVADTPETYIWKIVPSGKGALIATGDAGKIYRLEPGGNLELVADLQAANVTGLEPGRDGHLVTTDTPGRLLELSPQGTARVLYDADEPEVRSPVLAPDGGVFFAVNPQGGPGRVLHRTTDGAVETVWTAPSGYVYSLSLGSGGDLWATAGSDSGPGSVLDVTPGPPPRWMETARVDEPQVLTGLWGEPGSEWIGTGGVGRLYRLGGAEATGGTVTSEVQDAQGDAAWGALTVRPVPRGVMVETRSGETHVPDATWSDWASVRLDPDRGRVASPKARFLQWRLTLHDPGSRVSQVEVAYLPANLGPSIASAEVSELGASLGKVWDRGPPASLSQTLAGGVRVEFQPGGGRPQEGEAGDEEAAWARRYRGVTWDASDPNGDDLRYDLYLRALTETDWRPLKKDLESSPWIWDSATVPDGWYVIEVRASDREDNPPGQGLQTARDTDPFAVDNTPPRVSGLRVAGGTLAGSVEDDASAIKKIEMAVDGKPWTAVFPEDGIPDMPKETFSVPLSSLEPLEKGDHVIMVRAFDQAGNPGTGRVEFTR